VNLLELKYFFAERIGDQWLGFISSLRCAAISNVLWRMPRTLSYRHRTITDEDLISIRDLIAAHPASSRRDLSMNLHLPTGLTCR
jgi:hypothetical protein